MSRGRLATLACILSLLIGVTAASGMDIHVERDKVYGRVFDASTNRGIPGMIVRLTPPLDSQEPERIARTGGDGDFSFTRIGRGQYLLQVYQGSILLFRRLIDTTKDEPYVVRLRRRQ
jgi:hypothetical protein